MVVKCSDLSREDERLVKQGVSRETSALKSLKPVNCIHLPQILGSNGQNPNFTIDGANENNSDPSKWNLHYRYLGYEPYGDLDQIIEMHRQAGRQVLNIS
jgi:hypothetical protein